MFQDKAAWKGRERQTFSECTVPRVVLPAPSRQKIKRSKLKVQ